MITHFKFTICILIAIFFIGCSSGKKSYEHGYYYDSVLKSVNRLRKNPNHKKSAQTLREAYPLAVEYYEDRGNNLTASNDPNKWRGVVDAYSKINTMYEEIRRAPGALRVIPNPVDYYSQLDEAKNNAAMESYTHGEEMLVIGTRESAKKAYRYFKTANEFVRGYKDVVEKMDEALWLATLKVVVEPIPVASRNLEVSSEFFENKFNEYVHSSNINEFVRFYTVDEAMSDNLEHPDHIITLGFDEFQVGQIYFKEKEELATKDSVVVATIYRDTDTSETGNNNNNNNNNDINNDNNDDQNNDNTNTGDQKITICHHPPGNPGNKKTMEVSVAALQAHLDHGDRIGPCEGNSVIPTTGANLVSYTNTRPDGVSNQVKEEKIYATVKATVFIYTKTITSNGVLDFRIIDAGSNSVISQEKLPGEFIWQTQWATFNGDERALTEEQLELSKLKEAPPPSPQALFIEFTKPIFDQMTQKVRDFYRNY